MSVNQSALVNPILSCSSSLFLFICWCAAIKKFLSAWCFWNEMCNNGFATSAWIDSTTLNSTYNVKEILKMFGVGKSSRTYQHQTNINKIIPRYKFHYNVCFFTSQRNVCRTIYYFEEFRVGHCKFVNVPCNVSCHWS